MSSWNIQPDEVQGVLVAVAGHIGEAGGREGLIGAADRFADYFNMCVESANDPAIVTSLYEFADHHFGLVEDMAALTSSALQGASEATVAYIEGDLEMAAEHEAAAGVVPEPESARYSEPLP